VSLDAPGSEASPLDSDERSRLRIALGADGASEELFERPSRPRAPEPRTDDDVAFQLIDLERKVDKLLDSAVLIDELAGHVRELSEHVVRLERALIGRR